MKLQPLRLHLPGNGSLNIGLLLLTALVSATASPEKYVVHEWGTFTSVQGGDGVLLDWRPLETSRLPGFVYNWSRPGLGRVSSSGLNFTKSSLITLQRMETPVIYFYSEKQRDVDVTVDFPKGLITEWFPQAAQIGPSLSLNSLAQDCVSNAPATGTTDQSRAQWARVRVLPKDGSAERNAVLKADNSGSHYFSARETDSALVQVDSLVATNPAPEFEKFIFYRGAGSFVTPLQVKVTEAVAGDGAHTVTITNMASQALNHLFLLGVQNGKARFIAIKRLQSGERRIIDFAGENAAPMAEVSQSLGKQMKQSLINAGLYAREAEAMVKTWKDSWFEEDGFRVLYILPRNWTDQTLPMKLSPAPRELTRVMVGRAEVLTPGFQKKLVLTLARAGKGDPMARNAASAQLGKLGRFARPSLALAEKNSPEAAQTGWQLLQTAVSSSSPFE